MSDRCVHGARRGTCDEEHPTPDELNERLDRIEKAILKLAEHITTINSDGQNESLVFEVEAILNDYNYYR
jgi:hypothetical protein